MRTQANCSEGAHKPQTVILAGPTAVGKSDIALLLAELVGGEIISVDSMQVYRGLDIGTAKPSAEDRGRVPHHLIDILDLTCSFNAAEFRRRAQVAAREIQQRGRIPILCGGTGLYFKAFLEGLGEAPAPDRVLRNQLEATPLPELLRELSEHDPLTFSKIDQQNRRRVVRALEVIRLSGRPFSAQRAAWNPGPAQGAIMFGLKRPREDLQHRIEVRTEEMFRRGLVEETRSLLPLGLAENQTVMQAIGYRQAVEHLRGLRSVEDTIGLVKVRTKQFAKRQLTWFNRQLALNWIDIGADTDSRQIALKLSERMKAASD